jgi:hypothetical protein
MIFPEQYKHVGHASTKPCDDKVYFLSRWLLRDTPGGHEVLEVTLDGTKKGMMLPVLASRVLAQENEVYSYPDKVNLHNRTRLIELALDTGHRCTIFTGHDEHQTFVLDPDLSGILKVHVYDVSPPRPSLSSCIRELEDAGLFGDLSVQFCHHIRDITEVHADVYPCRAAGFERTLDTDAMQGGEQVAGCLTASIPNVTARIFSSSTYAPLNVSGRNRSLPAAAGQNGKVSVRGTDRAEPLFTGAPIR